jgi:hypothetical protein
MLTFGSFGCVFLSLQVIATATAFFDFVGLFSHWCCPYVCGRGMSNAAARRHGDTATRRLGDSATRRHGARRLGDTAHGDSATRRHGARRHGDTATRRHGDTATRRHGDTATRRHGGTATRRTSDSANRRWLRRGNPDVWASHGVPER